MRVSLLLTCTADLLYPAAASACVKVLEALGLEVDFPHLQTCCGQPWLNTGHLDGARRLALHCLEVFEKSDAVVAVSSSCADTLRNRYAELFPDSPALRDRMEGLGRKTYEFCEYLHRVLALGTVPAHPRPSRTTYHSSCRTLRGVGLDGVAEGYLARMLGAEFVPLPENETCCGFGGSFSVKLPEVSGRLMADKLRNIEATGASQVVSLDLSCLTHLSTGAERLGLGRIRFVHLAQVLAEAMNLPISAGPKFPTRRREDAKKETMPITQPAAMGPFMPGTRPSPVPSGTGFAPSRLCVKQTELMYPGSSSPSHPLTPSPHRGFRTASAEAVADEVLRAAIRKTADLLYTRRAASVVESPGFEELRQWGRSRKLEVSGRLRQYTQEFASRVEALGGTVHFARDSVEATELITRIALERGARTAVKSKSMTAEEVRLNEALLEAGVKVTETDLGEFIIQLAGEKPSHLLSPAIHKDRNQVARLFHESLGTPPGLDVEELVRAARLALRQRFLTADLGITGANFAVAETGSLVLVTNEGNGRMTTTLPRVQITIAGIDKIIPSMSDLPGFLRLLTRSACGQAISSYMTLITGPRKQGEDEGPEELHVVLLDNGRSDLANGPFREILHCLHCGACLNQCPVYRAVGGHAYGSVYPGPMGDVLSPLIWGMEAYPDLPDACTLCGRCAETCPVRIPLPEYHLKLRALRARGRTRAEMAATLSAAATASTPLYRGALGLFRKFLAEHGGLLERTTAANPWTTCRELPRPQAGPDFRTWWRDRKRSHND